MQELNYSGFAVPLTQPQSVQPIVSLIQPKNVQPYLSPLLAVPTTLSNILSITLNQNIYLTSISFLPSSNASTNNVQFYMTYGYYTLGKENELCGLAVPTTFTFPNPYYPVLYSGQQINIYAVASATGSYIQFAYIGILV